MPTICEKTSVPSSSNSSTVSRALSTASRLRGWGGQKKGRVTPCYVCYKGHVSRPVAAMLDTAVEAELFKRLSEVDPSEFESHDADDSAVLSKIEELERQLAEWEAEAIAGRVSPGVFGRAERDLNGRIEALRAKLIAPPKLELDREEWPELPMFERRQIVRGFFEVVVPKLERWVRAKPDDVLIAPI
jgi:hypothetical protein